MNYRGLFLNYRNYSGKRHKVHSLTCLCLAMKKTICQDLLKNYFKCDSNVNTDRINISVQ